MAEEKRSGVYVDVDEQLLREFKAKCAIDGRSLKDVINEFINRYVSPCVIEGD